MKCWDFGTSDKKLNDSENFFYIIYGKHELKQKYIIIDVHNYIILFETSNSDTYNHFCRHL